MNKVWRVTAPTGRAPGSFYIFLSDGTLVMTSCVETYRLAEWRAETGGKTTIIEDPIIRYAAEIREINDRRLSLRLHLKNERVELTLEAAEKPYACPDLSVATIPVVATPLAFRAPTSVTGRMVLSTGKLRFVACGARGDGILLADLPSGDGEALVQQLGAGERGITVMTRIDGDRLQEIRYGGLEGPSCDRLPPDGEVEARGNEPFWILKVDGAGALLRTPAEQDGLKYSAGEWSRPDGVRWLYQSRREGAHGVESLLLELTEQRCMDSMSGARYPFRAVLVRDGDRMDGCALEGQRSNTTMTPR